MGDINDDRQEYIPANRSGRPLQRPLSAHVSNRPSPPAVPGLFQKQQGAGNVILSPYRRIHSAAPYRPPRPLSASVQPAPVPAWGDTPAPLNQSYANGHGATVPTTGLFAGMELPPSFSRQDHSRVVPSKEPESMEDELRKMRQSLSTYKEQNRLLTTERKRLEEQLGKARTNLVKAEELLNAREKALSPTIGLSQMYRTPETTALVTRLKEQVKQLREEKDRFKGDLEELLRSTKATRVAELQSEAHALSQELSRQVEMTAIMRWRMEKAEELAAEAQQKAEAAEAKARQYTEAGSVLPPGPVRLAPGNTIAAGRVRKTMAAMQQSHRVLLSQAALLRAVFPPGLSMEALAAKAELKTSTAGAVEVVRYMRYHLNKLTSEMSGLPGGRPDENAALEVASPPPAPKPSRPRSARPQSAGPAGNGPAEVVKPPEASSDPRLLLQGMADLVRELRSMDMDGFMARPDLEADVEQLADVAGLLIAEHKRLTGSCGASSVFNEDIAQENPLYTPVPKSDLVDPEFEKDEPVEAEPELAEYEPVADEDQEDDAHKEAADKEEEEKEKDNGDDEEYPDDFLEQDEPMKAEETPAEEKSTLEEPPVPEESDEEKAKAAVAKVMAAAEKAEAVVAKLEAIAARLAPEAPEKEPSNARSHATEAMDPEAELDSPTSVSSEPEPAPEPAAEVAAPSLPLSKEFSAQSARSIASSHSPDTPKRIEGPASSVGDPAEYGTRRSSITGSVYSTRGWQPADDVLREEDDEPGLIGVALAAAAAVMLAEEENEQPEEADEMEATESLAPVAEEPEQEAEDLEMKAASSHDDQEGQEPEALFAGVISAVLDEAAGDDVQEPEKEASKQMTADAPSLERQPGSTTGGEPSIEETPWWDAGLANDDESDEQSEATPASNHAASHQEGEDPGYESPRGEVTLQDIASVEPKEPPAKQTGAESAGEEEEQPAPTGWPDLANPMDDFYEDLNQADDDGKLFADDDEPAPRQTDNGQAAAARELVAPADDEVAAPSDPDAEQPQSSGDWRKPALSDYDGALADLGSADNQPQDAEELPPANDSEEPVPLGDAWETPSGDAQELAAKPYGQQLGSDEVEDPAASAGGLPLELANDAEEPTPGDAGEELFADDGEALSAPAYNAEPADNAEEPPASAGDAEEPPAHYADELVASADDNEVPLPAGDDAEEQPLPAGDDAEEQPLPAGDDAEEQPLPAGDDAEEQPLPAGDDAEEQPLPAGDDAEEFPVDYADDADELPAPTGDAEELPTSADDQDQAPAAGDYGAEEGPAGEEADPASVDEGLPTPTGNADWYDDGEAALPADDELAGSPAVEDAAEEKDPEPADADTAVGDEADDQAGAVDDADAQDTTGQNLDTQVSETAQPGDDEQEKDTSKSTGNVEDDAAPAVNSGAKDKDDTAPLPVAAPTAAAPTSRPAAADDDDF